MEYKNINQKWVNIVNNAVFPIILTTDNGTVEGQGLTKRELFAAMAMQGLFSSGENRYGSNTNDLAEYAVSIAEALLTELNKRK